MAVEILILSGARRNERVTLDGREFRVGCEPDCEIFFDPRRDDAIGGRSAQFRLQENGWYVHGAGGEIWIDGRRVVGATHVRSGDLIRLSEAGPEFSFRVVAGAAASQPKTPLPEPGREPAAGLPCSKPFAADALGPTGRAIDDLSTAILEAADAAVPPTFKHRSNHVQPTHSDADRRWVAWGVGGLAVGVLALLAARSLLAPSTVIVNVGQPSAATPSALPPTGAPIAQETPQETPAPSDKSENPAPNEKSRAYARAADAVYLIQVEKADRFWPFATCVAVAGDTLLTTAREAAQLARWRESRKFKVWVTRQAGDFREEAKEIRVIAPFVAVNEASDDLFYVDVGLLTVGRPLPNMVPVALPKELGEVEEGFPVTCVGFTHEGGKVTRFDIFEPRQTVGKVYLIACAQNLPGQPKLLHVQAEMPKNAYGSPVVNAAGKVIGLYGDVIPETKGLKNLHYVTLVNSEWIDRWRQDRGGPTWTAPRPSPSTRQMRGKP